MPDGSRPPARYPFVGDSLHRDVPSVSDEAHRLTQAAITEQSPTLARRALTVRAEARLQRHVRSWSRPALDGDAGTHGPGRGVVEAATIPVMAYCPRADGYVPTATCVAKRTLTRTMKALPPHLLPVAIAYQALHERRGAIRCINVAALSHGSGGRSDGGAAARWDDGQMLADMERAIGNAVALAVCRNRRLRSDYGSRRDVTVREVVDAVVLDGKAPLDVLGRAGWSSRYRLRKQIVVQLIGALERMDKCSQPEVLT